MKKILLSIFLLLSPICFAQNINQPINKVVLKEKKNEIIELLKEGDRNTNELKVWGQIYFVSMKIMNEVCSHEIVQKYLLDTSNCIFDLFIYKEKSLKKATNIVSYQVDDEKIHQLLFDISNKYLSDAIESGKISNRCNIQVLNDCCTLTFGTIILNNLLQKIEATLQDPNK